MADTADRVARPPLRGGPAPVRSLPVRRAVCPGSFDPVTNGHVDVITRAAGLYDELVVAVLVNPGKAGLFSVTERMELLRESVADLPNVTVDSFEGLLVDYCRAHDIPVIVKGLRAVSDFEYELQMAQMNRELAAVETLFVPTAPQVGHLSSSLVKQIATFGGDVSRLVPKVVDDRLRERTRREGPRDRGGLPAVRDRRRADDGHRERPQRPDVGLVHGAARPPAGPARRPARVVARGRAGRRRDRRAAHRDPPAGPGRGGAAHRPDPGRASSCWTLRGGSATNCSAPHAASATSCSPQPRPTPTTSSPRPRRRPSGWSRRAWPTERRCWATPRRSTPRSSRPRTPSTSG
ncbi:pantetheine-phosphate adenylyltransferase [Blastococcus brunescens]|uniref:Phosphopantetheine adenylyltransferase n=1 Tax=Blastococcus brunescens TaxID=1564165 RepID=A0ABZ1AVJ4_9ACTN|nr:pantetheine-phosphate adenylyltransferase [Blastococcus sp. BMG 8361]WRL62577.1 pantetheine-phosphate adenylyltransferase [Blastococcus sp. BMG 8361]